MQQEASKKTKRAEPAAVTADDVSLDSGDEHPVEGTGSANEVHKRKLKFEKFRKNQEKKKKALQKQRAKGAEAAVPTQDDGSSDDSEDEYVSVVSHVDQSQNR